MADLDGSGVGSSEAAPAYAGAAGGAAPDSAAVQAQGLRQRRAEQDAAVQEHKGKNIEEMRAELEKKRALVADMRKWNNRLNVVLMIVIIPFSALICACPVGLRACVAIAVSPCTPSRDSQRPRLPFMCAPSSVFSLFKTQLIEWCHAGPPVFFPRMFPEACTWLRGFFPEDFQQLTEAAKEAAKAAQAAAAAAAAAGSESGQL